MPNTRRWRGNAPAVAQVDLVTIYHVEDGVTFTLTQGGKSVSYTADADDTVTTVMAALAAFWEAEIVPQFSEISADASDGTMILIADNAGVPFDLTGTQSGTGGNVEIKTVTVNNSPTGGTWSWIDSTYGTVSGIAYNVSAATLTTALEAIYGAGRVTATGSNGGPFTVTFGGTLAHVNIPDVTFNSSSLTGGNATVSVAETIKGSAGTSEVQTINFYGSPSGGTWTATFNGFTTAALAHNITTGNLQSALRALASIGANGVTISGSAGAWVVTFAGALASTAVGLITVDTTLLTGGTIFGTIATTTPGVAGVNSIHYIAQQNQGVSDEVFNLKRTGTVSGGTFRFTWDISGNLAYSAPIAFNAKLYEIIAALEALALAEQGITYIGPYFAPTQAEAANVTIGDYGGNLFISCVGNVGGTNIIPGSGIIQYLGIDSSTLTGGGSYSFPSTDSLNGNDGGTTLASNGAFRLSVGGQQTTLLNLSTSGPVVNSPTAAQVQSALETLSTVGTGNVSVRAFAQGNGSESGARGLWIIEFIGALAGTAVSVADSDNVIPTGSGSYWFAKSYQVRQGVAGTNEVQTVTLSGAITTGTFTLSHGSQTTSPIAYNATAADIDTALEALSNIAVGDVTCTGGALPGSAVTVTYTGGLQFTNIAQLVINDNGLKSKVVETTPGVTTTNEVQTISLTGNPHGGTATLTYSGQTTSAIAYNAAAATIQTALEALSNLAPVDVVCTGGPWPAAVVLTFGGTLAATDVAALTGSGTSLHNGTVTETSINPMTLETLTENSGPGDISVAANWSDETLPVTGDTVVFDQGSSPALYHLDQLATGLAAFYQYARFTGEIGLPEINTELGDAYYEYRPQYLVVDAPVVDIGIGGGNGSGRIKIKGVVGTAPVVNVHKTDTGLDDGIESLLLVLPNTSSVVNVNRGSVGIAIYPGETSTVPTLRIGFETNLAGDSTVRCGSGVTLTTVEMSGGQLTTNSAIATVNMTDGELIHETGGITTANIDGGSVRYKSASTLVTAVVGNGGNLDFRQDLRSRTLTNLTLNAGSEYHDPHGTVTLTNGVDFVRCRPTDCEFDVIPNRTWTPSTI